MNRGSTFFLNSNSAGSATINNSGNLRFNDISTAGSAALSNNAGGTIDFSGSAGSNGDGRLSAGSIAGAGDFLLGANELTVGSNNLSTEVSDAIRGAAVAAIDGSMLSPALASAWLTPLGGRGHVAADANAAALEWWHGGLAGGYEIAGKNALAGLAFGYQRGSAGPAMAVSPRPERGPSTSPLPPRAHSISTPGSGWASAM